jgi:hypothetical protein
MPVPDVVDSGRLERVVVWSPSKMHYPVRSRHPPFRDGARLDLRYSAANQQPDGVGATWQTARIQHGSEKPVLPDDPADLILGKKYGSEGTAQRYLCALLINGSSYGYHKSWALTERGGRFVAGLYSRRFGSAPPEAPQFWNEMNLRAVDADDEHAVDFGFIWPQVHFLVELKTLGSSDRPGQLAEYLLRARHHSPNQAIDLLYLTQPMTAATPDDMPERCRFAHMTWLEALDLADSVWGDSDDPREVRCLGLLRDHLDREGALAVAPVPRRKGTKSRAVAAEDLPPEWQQVVAGAVAAALQAAAGRRMAVDVPVSLVTENGGVKRLLQRLISSEDALSWLVLV